MLINAHDGFPLWVGAGADFLEVDVRRAADGTFVLSHDEPAAGARPPSLDDALRAGCPLQLDLKEDGTEEALIQHALRHVAATAIAVTTGADDSVKTVKEAFPQVRCGLTLAEEPGESTWRRIDRCHADFVAVDHRYAHHWATSDLPVWLWTVDDERLLKRYIGEGWPEAIITNRPVLALKIRKGRS